MLPAHADDVSGLSDKTRQEVLQIAEIIKSENMVRIPEADGNFPSTEGFSVEEKLHFYRYLISDALDREEIERANIVLDALHSLAEEHSSLRNLKFVQIVKEYLRLHRSEVWIESNEAINTLRGLQNDSDWFVKNMALLYEAALQLDASRLDEALRISQAAIKVIPDEPSYYAKEASYETNAFIGMIYLYSANLELATPAIKGFLAQGLSIDRKIGGLTVLSNLVYALQNWKEYELAEHVAETGYTLAVVNNAASQSQSAFRYSQALNSQGKFSKALKIADEGLAFSGPNIWKLNLEAQRAIALAGLGRTPEANAELRKFKTSLQEFPQYESRFNDRFRTVDALLAVESNNAKRVYEIMNETLTLETQGLLRQSSDETQKLLGTLDNEKALQKVREDKLELERSLALERAEAAAKRSLFLSLIVILMAIAIALTIWFATYQRKVARESAHLRAMAEAGERSKSHFLAIMSHELRTPLNGIIGLADMLMREGPNKDVRFKNGVILKSGLQLLDIVSNVLDMSQMETRKLAIKPSPIDIRDVVTNIEGLWVPRAKQNSIILSFHVEDTVPPVLSLDPARTLQCLENLISNAIKFTSKGRVHVHVSYGANNDNDNGNILTLFIADTGKGMEPAEQLEIFEAFTQADTSTTRQFGGSGLGLAITRSLARLMGGDVTVQSTAGRGSEFTLTIEALPLAGQEPLDISKLKRSPKENILRAEATHKRINNQDLPKTNFENTKPEVSAQSAQMFRLHKLAPKNVNKPASLRPVNPAPETLDVNREPAPELRMSRSKPAPQISAPLNTAPNDLIKNLEKRQDIFNELRVLIVDDIMSNHDVMKIFLAPVGCKITSVMNGREAVKATLLGDFDVILMDIRMPEMNGIEAMEAIKKQGARQAEIPIITMTADTSAENNAQCIAAGASVFMTKPVVSSELFGAIRFVLESNEDTKKNRAPFSQAV